MKRLLLPLLAALALPTTVNAGMRFERIATGYCSTSQKKAPKGSDCFSFIETNDGDPSVFVLGKKYPNLESKKSLKPIPWGGRGATQGNYLTRYTMEIRLHYLENEARKTIINSNIKIVHFMTDKFNSKIIKKFTRFQN